VTASVVSKPGMDGYVSKPISSKEGNRSHCRHPAPAGSEHACHRSGSEQADAALPTAPRIVWNMGETLERLGDDETLFHEVMEIFLDEVPKHLASLGRAITAGDAEAVEGAAHTLKGELGYLGISEVSQKARELRSLAGTQIFDLLRISTRQFASELSGLLTSMRSTMRAHPSVEVVAGSPGSTE